MLTAYHKELLRSRAKRAAATIKIDNDAHPGQAWIYFINCILAELPMGAVLIDDLEVTPYIIATRETSDMTGYCRACGTTVGEAHHPNCDYTNGLTTRGAYAMSGYCKVCDTSIAEPHRPGCAYAK